MPREKEGFRDQLERLIELFPNKEVIDIAEASRLLGSSRETLVGAEGFPKKKLGGKWIVPIVALARWLS